MGGRRGGGRRPGAGWPLPGRRREWERLARGWCTAATLGLASGPAPNGSARGEREPAHSAATTEGGRRGAAGIRALGATLTLLGSIGGRIRRDPANPLRRILFTVHSQTVGMHTLTPTGVVPGHGQGTRRRRLYWSALTTSRAVLQSTSKRPLERNFKKSGGGPGSHRSECLSPIQTPLEVAWRHWPSCSPFHDTAAAPPAMVLRWGAG